MKYVSPELSLSYILKAHRSFSSGVPEPVMSVASMNSCFFVSENLCICVFVHKCQHFYMFIWIRVLSCPVLSTVSNWYTIVANSKMSSPWNQCCRSDLCQKSWRFDQQIPEKQNDSEIKATTIIKNHQNQSLTTYRGIASRHDQRVNLENSRLSWFEI